MRASRRAAHEAGDVDLGPCWITRGSTSRQHADPSRYAPEKIPYGIKRYQEETQRLYTVLEDGLNAGKGEWLVGDKYSIADINGESTSARCRVHPAQALLTTVFGWVNSHAWAGIDITPTPKLAAWVERIKARKGVYNGLGVPERRKPPTKEEEEKQAEEARKWIFKK